MARVFRLQKMIREHFLLHGSNWSMLERAIETASTEARKGGPSAKAPRHPDRRKLQKLAEGVDVPLRQSDFEALDDYFNTRHQGLAFVPIFERSGLLATLVAPGHVHVLIGARDADHDYGKTIAVSHFDTRAHADLARQLNSQGQDTKLDLHIVLRRKSAADARAVIEETWQSALSHEDAVVSIASPLANHGTELMWSRMFACAPYDPAPVSRPTLAFVLPDSYVGGACSGFVEGPARARRLDAKKAADIHDRRWALRVGDQLFLADPEDQQNAKTYGVIVAQRRSTGQIWVAAAGLHGAGTHAAALAFAQADLDLSAGHPGANGRIHVRVVEALVTHTTSAGTTISKVEHSTILKPHVSFDAPTRPAEPF